MKFATALPTFLAVIAASTSFVDAQNIVEVAQGVEELSTLVDLVVQAIFTQVFDVLPERSDRQKLGPGDG